jgi:hypothetical protein
VPDVETVRRIKKLLTLQANYEYFFQEIGADPSWVGPLTSEEFFATPPPAIRTGDYVWFPPWAATKYLSRVAAAAPEAVAAAIRSVPDTDNSDVRADLVEAVSKLPAGVAASFVPTVALWLRAGGYLVLPERVTELIRQLAAGGKREALDLTSDLLAVSLPVAQREGIEPRSEMDAADPADEASVVSAFLTRPKPQGHMDLWRYGAAIEELRRPLVMAFGLEALRLFLQLLGRALLLSRSDPDDGKTESMSYVSRPTVEGGSYDTADSVEDLLVNAVRDVSSDLIDLGLSDVGTVVAALARSGRPIERRIGLHLLAVVPGAPRNLIAEEASDPAFVWSPQLRHEAVLLLEARFGLLNKRQQRAFERAVESDPREDWPRRDAETRRYLDLLRRDWLGMVEPYLSVQGARLLGQLVQKYGKPNSIPDPFGVSTWSVGPTSPLSNDELGRLAAGAVADYARGWVPSGDWMSPSTEGLGRAIADAAAARPSEFVAALDRFVGLRPVLVDGVLEGIRRGGEAGHSLDWPVLLGFCDWILQQQDSDVGPALDWDESLANNWRHPRLTVARILSVAFTGKAPLGAGLRRRAWRLLALLIDDVDPDKRTSGMDSMGPATLSINSVRGEAMHAVMRYRIWLHNRYSERARPVPAAALREWRELLVARLDPALEPSAAVRSVYGFWFPALVAHDEAWAASIRPRVFATEPGSEPLYRAAWNSYLTFGGAYWRPFVVLRREYALALKELRPSAAEVKLTMEQTHLVHHVIRYYCSGFLRLDRGRGAMHDLFEGMPAAGGHALWVIGRDLISSPQVWSAEPLGRVRRLWQWRLQALELGANGRVGAEVPAMAMFYASRIFPRKFALESLVRGLRLLPKVERDDDVMATLLEDMRPYPKQVLEAVRLLVGTSTEEWTISGWEGPLREIIRLGMSEAGTREEADELANYLVARGQPSYQDLV